MSDHRHYRVTREIAHCNHDETTNINIELIDDSPFHLRGSFQGPQDSIYEGGHFELDIIIPDHYPFTPPKVKFIKVYHPNISVSGAISLDILEHHWSPAISLNVLLISLQSFLCSPEPCSPAPNDDSQDTEVARQYSSSRKSVEDTARNWTRIYARRSSQP